MIIGTILLLVLFCSIGILLKRRCRHQWVLLREERHGVLWDPYLTHVKRIFRCKRCGKIVTREKDERT